MSIKIKGSTVIDDSQNITVTGGVADSFGSVRNIPLNTQSSSYILALSDVGKVINTTAGVTVPSATFFSGNAVSVYNNSTSSITITQGSGTIMYQTGTNNTGNRTLAQRGVATILCVSSNTFVITGGGLT